MSAIIAKLDTLLHERGSEIEAWLSARRAEHAPFFYSSVDLRHSGSKLSPVDTNLFPAGFNQLSDAARKRAVTRMRARFQASNAKRVLIVPENHTRNLGYLENLAVLSDLVAEAGADVRIGSLPATEPLVLATLSGREITEAPLVRNGNKLSTQDGFEPDMILLNNDCTAGIPSLLEHLEQPVEPPYQMGWYTRRKSEHFRVYETLARELAEAFDFDPWLISTLSHRCGVVNFHEQKGIECVALGVEKVLHGVRRKYEEHGISDTPYVFIKADSGTYGMGIMTVRSGEEMMELNKKARNKMNVIKEGTQNTEVIIQEGVPTIDRIEDASAEPMIYLVDGKPVGGAYRINTERDTMSNLNAAGMRFVGMCDEGEKGESEKDRIKIAECNFGAFGLIATLAALAAPRETYGGWNIGFSI